MLRKAITQVSSAVAKKDVVPLLTHYYFARNQIIASDGRITACAPCDDLKGIECLTSASQVDALMLRLRDPIEIKQADNVLSMSSGRYRGRVETLPEDQEYYFVKPEGDKFDLSETFFDSLRILRKFVSEDATHMWSICVAMRGKYLMASNNKSLAVTPHNMEYKGEECLIPVWAVDFILERTEGLTQFSVGGGAMSFYWTDGSWMRAQLVMGTFPSIAEQMLKVFKKPDFAITPDWREAFGYVSAFGADRVELHKDRMLGKNQLTTADAEAETPIPEKKQFSIWNPKVLAPVIECATHWSPVHWPNPCYFSAPGLRGIVTGLSE